ncbi:MAG: SPOR domain-containing protein [Pseudomonadota bacterium]|nr:SPOR domain-containing protein [Pseudomonadota bacterium]
MSIFALQTLRLSAVLLASASATQVCAQARFPAGAVVQSLIPDPGSALAGHLRTLSAAPRSLSALLGAGKAALALGDPQSALTFFARAEEVAPRDGYVKAGMGSAFVQLEQIPAAAKFFEEAAALGAPTYAYAKDRGLVYDIMGQQARAQADYRLALTRGSDAEAERRLALSLAISGDRAGALAALDPQLRRQDRAGWRARAFVLALSGDIDEAATAVGRAMPGGADKMRPFLERLPALSSADKALAVHFGRFTGNVQAPVQVASNESRVQYRMGGSAATNAGRPDSRQPALRATRWEKPKAEKPAPALPVGRRVVTPPASVAVVPPPAVQPEPMTVETRPAEVVRIEPVELPASTPAELVAAPVETPVAAAPEAAPVPVPQRPAIDFASVAAAVRELPDPLSTKRAEPEAEAAAPAAAASEPSRLWVQLAAAQNKAAFPAEFRRLKGKTKLLADKTPWTAPLRSTNRLLVGPFGSEQEARDLVNELAKSDIASFSWTSGAGQAIEKLPAK